MSNLLHIVLNDYINDNRVRRAAECGHNTGFNVVVYALSKSNREIHKVNAGVSIFHIFLLTRKLPKKALFQFFKYIEMVIRMVHREIKFRPRIVHAHDLNALVIGYLISKLVKCKLIYDSHEYWQDANPHRKSKLKLFALRILERYLINRVDVCITVSNGIAELLKSGYSIERPSVIRNLPEKWRGNHSKKLRAIFGINEDVVVFLYQGNINGQWVLDLLEAFILLDNRNTALVYLGNGDQVEELMARKTKQVYFHPSVSYEELPEYTSDADVGVHPMYGVIKNQLFALPNKIFEYIQGGLALVVSDLPEMSCLINNHEIGLTFTPGNIAELVNAMKKLAEDNQLREHCKTMASQLSYVLNWNEEETLLKSIYIKLV